MTLIFQQKLYWNRTAAFYQKYYRPSTPRPVPAQSNKKPPSRDFKIKDWTHQDYLLNKSAKLTCQQYNCTLTLQHLILDCSKHTTIRLKLKIERDLKKNLNTNKILNTIRFLKEAKLNLKRSFDSLKRSTDSY